MPGVIRVPECSLLTLYDDILSTGKYSLAFALAGRDIGFVDPFDSSQEEAAADYPIKNLDSLETFYTMIFGSVRNVRSSSSETIVELECPKWPEYARGHGVPHYLNMLFGLQINTLDNLRSLDHANGLFYLQRDGGGDVSKIWTSCTTGDGPYDVIELNIDSTRIDWFSIGSTVLVQATLHIKWVDMSREYRIIETDIVENISID
ncbi:hypothetical protein C8R43DRAFT_1143139 [Mycena crocata]|nr:hypothetical protein C8R43DRAFT_1143139 [Mycena crocata]